MERIREFVDYLRGGYPWSLRFLGAGSALLAAGILITSVPESPLLNAIGVTAIQKRAAALANAVYWSARAIMNRSSTETPTTLFGNLEGVDPTGKLIATVPTGRQWVRHYLHVADATVVDVYGVAKLVRPLRNEDARFDIYRGDQAVVWMQGVPFNVKLIEAGVAMPDPHPPTNIVAASFAAYYWSLTRQ